MVVEKLQHLHVSELLIDWHKTKSYGSILITVQAGEVTAIEPTPRIINIEQLRAHQPRSRTELRARRVIQQ